PFGAGRALVPLTDGTIFILYLDKLRSAGKGPKHPAQPFWAQRFLLPQPSRTGISSDLVPTARGGDRHDALAMAEPSFALGVVTGRVGPRAEGLSLPHQPVDVAR